MSMTLAEIEAEVMKLSFEERELLAEAIYSSMDNAEGEVDPETLAEAKRRYEELRSGTVKGDSLEDVLAHLQAPLE
jgi:putative addiction module component (TIGR02574 family)